MIQVHGKTILSMEFNPIIKAHGSNLWQIIHQSPSPIMLSNILSKAQYNLAIFLKVHGKVILSMEFNPIIKAHGSSPWQIN